MKECLSADVFRLALEETLPMNILSARNHIRGPAGTDDDEEDVDVREGIGGPAAADPSVVGGPAAAGDMEARIAQGIRPPPFQWGRAKTRMSPASLRPWVILLGGNIVARIHIGQSSVDPACHRHWLGGWEIRTQPSM